jgi:hypothetical protein
MKSESNRQVGAAEEATIIEKFVQRLVKESSLGSESAVKDAISQFVHDNGAKLSAPQADQWIRLKTPSPHWRN